MWGIILYLLRLFGLSPVSFIANCIGTTEPALNVLVSLLMSYPLGIIYHKFIRQLNNGHLYFALCGLDMAFFNFGSSIYHNMMPIFFMFATTKIFGPTMENCVATFIFNMVYLVAGYIYTESENYDITWTMPHCVLTLKLIALSFDLLDGNKMKLSIPISENQKATAVLHPPSLLDLFGFVYFPACFMVGPTFSFKRYTLFIVDMYPLTKAATEARQKESVKTLALGIACLLFHQIGGIFFNMEHMMSEGFTQKSILYRHFYCGIWAYIALSKYISCWLIAEGACILFGLSYNRHATTDSQRWHACSNIKLYRFLTATKFHHYIESFNCNTNYFAAEYVYKRLKYFNNRYLSQGATLFFLALWHGIHSGYYVTFFNEFLIILMEKEAFDIISKTTIYAQAWSNPVVKCVLLVFLKAYTIVFMGWSLAPFDLKIFSKWFYVYSTLWFSGYIVFVPWAFLYKPFLKKIIKKYNLFSENGRTKIQ